jgi:biopolymer transport protein ExbD
MSRTVWCGERRREEHVEFVMPLKTCTDEFPHLNLTSMIDVLLLVILFFIAGTQFNQTEHELGLNVPQVHGAADSLRTAPGKTVHVDRAGYISLDGRNLGLAELTQALQSARQQAPDLQITVRGDGQGAFQTVAEVLSACRQAGVSELAIAVAIARDETAAGARRE